MNIYELTETQVILFSLVLLRMIAFVFSAAIFSTPNVSAPLRVLFSLVLAMTVFPLLKIGASPGLAEDLVPSAAREVFIGLLIGYLSRLFFLAVSMTGDFVSILLGLSSAQLYNPMMQSQGGVIEHFHVLLGSMFFLLINGHHMLITAMMQSYDIVAVAGTAPLKFGGLAEIAQFGGDLLVITVKMSAPVLVAMLLANIAMGILGRAIPQLNVLVTSFPVTVLLGLGTMFVCLPLFVMEMHGLVDVTAMKLMQVMKSL